ncbi:HutD family protein, partial [Noviherbaspirillum denitrificans]
ALVASDGPFSAFPGIDRSLAILRGHGLHLAGDECRRMDEHAPPFVFRGEQRISATLKNGPVTDFNVMTRRAACAHTLEVMEVRDIHRCTPRSGLMLLYVARGQVACLGGRREICAEGESLLVDWREEPAIELAVPEPARICLAHITFKETQDD